MLELQIETIVQANKTLVLEDLPFEEGEKVKVTVTKTAPETNAENPYSLRGLPYKYENPFEPVILSEDWEALK